MIAKLSMGLRWKRFTAGKVSPRRATMKISADGCLKLYFKKNPIGSFFPLLQKGFFLEIITYNLLDLLCQTCGLGPAEVKDRIQTVFLNGKPVDDLTTVNVQDGDCLALSAAMPGLVGATMRSGGVLASFRHSISHRPSPARSGAHGGLLSIKLFNLLINEIGPYLLRHGILVEPDDLQAILTSRSHAIEMDCLKAELNARPARLEKLTQMGWMEKKELIRLEVIFNHC
jgi:hypothetical protein